MLHAGQTGDFYPHHMDAEWCKTQPFGQRMAHGTLIFSVGVGMTAGAINPRAMSYGYDRLRFVRPVFLNDTIRVKVSIKETRDDRQTSKTWDCGGGAGGGEPARRDRAGGRAPVTGGKTPRFGIAWCARASQGGLPCGQEVMKHFLPKEGWDMSRKTWRVVLTILMYAGSGCLPSSVLQGKDHGRHLVHDHRRGNGGGVRPAALLPH